MTPIKYGQRPTGQISSPRQRTRRSPASCLPLRDANGEYLCEIIPIYITPAEAAARAAQALYGLELTDAKVARLLADVEPGKSARRRGPMRQTSQVGAVA